MIIDTHMHLKIKDLNKISQSILNAEKIRQKFKISKIFLILLKSQKIGMDKFKHYPSKFKNIKFFVDIDPRQKCKKTIRSIYKQV